MNRADWPVLEHGIRPAGPPDRCFYCKAQLGEQHGAECVIRSRTVVVRAIVEYVIDVPESWTPHDIEFHRNDGSWCSSNGIDEIGLINERQGEGKCPCQIVKYEYVREASAEDEEFCGGPRVAELPT